MVQVPTVCRQIVRTPPFASRSSNSIPPSPFSTETPKLGNRVDALYYGL